ncbi:MAG TPA: nucleoside triphosphate pyrophosphatase [Burkholderiaceae bacterium]|nr:nucleoside triphosphate pyrophosphatase [Burkholderiaceae bacterium]
MTEVYLASRSPRRRELLAQIGVRFEPLPLRLAPPRGPDISEQQQPGETPAAYVERVARDKAEFGRLILSQRSMAYHPVLAADTEVILDGEIIGKPSNVQQASEFLRRLSNRTHEVRTTVAIAFGRGPSARLIADTSVSMVTFRVLTAEEIQRYTKSGEPYDKAGGYAIQGLAGVFIQRLEGSYSGVMGLPLYETAALLREAGVKVL